jgi:hypothetical protein
LLPDYHAIKGSNGGYAFPLFDRRRGPTDANISAILLAGLTQAYGEPVSADDAFNSVLALLSATSFTRRFAGDLEDKFPHVVFPAAAEVFRQAVAIGQQIREVETFARAPEAQGQAFCRLVDQPTGNVVFSELENGEIALCVDGSGRISGIPPQVWDFSVSGYRPLPRWIEGRVGLPADLAFVRDLRDVAARVAELIHRFDEADLVLQATLANSLSREELGFAGAVPEPVEEEDGGD